MITMKKTLAAMIAAISISGTAVMAADTKESITEIPNPITEYRTYGEVSAALGFSPLYLPGLAGYQCRYISAISGKTGDIRYVKDDGSEITVRSSRAGSMENISGVYGASWKKAPYRRHNGIRSGHFEKYMGGVLEKRAICIFRLRGAHNGN